MNCALRPANAQKPASSASFPTRFEPRFRPVMAVLAVTTALALSGCGGGSGSLPGAGPGEPAAQQPPPTQPPARQPPPEQDPGDEGSAGEPDGGTGTGSSSSASGRQTPDESPLPTGGTLTLHDQPHGLGAIARYQPLRRFNSGEFCVDESGHRHCVIAIPVGKSRKIGTTVFSCTEGTQGSRRCRLSIKENLGTVTYSGGIVKAETGVGTYIERFRVSDLSETPPAVVRALTVGYDYSANPRTTIALSDSADNSLTPRNATSPASGWTAKRFSLADNTGRGVVITNRGRGATAARDTWVEYFTRTSGEPTIRRQASTGKLEFVSGSAAGGDKDKYGEFIRLSKDFSFAFTVSGTTYNSISDIPVGTTVTIPAGTYTGTYRGKAGTFTVGAGGANTRPNADGTFVFPGGAPFPMTFLPDGSLTEINALTVETIPTAKDYLTFGYWLTTDGEGMTTKADIFARQDGHGGAFQRGAPTPAAGLARYSGAAVGVYALRNEDDTSNGEFVANANLETHFSQENTHIRGTIDNFRSTTRSQDQDALSRWSLELQQMPGFLVSEIGGRTHTSRTSSGEGTVQGVWNARFFGQDNTDSNRPTAVVGAFKGHFSNGSVAGAYAADKTYSCDQDC